MTYWLLSHDALQLRAARQLRGPVFGRALVRAQDKPALPAPLTVADGVATIRVDGVLTPTPDADAAWYGEPNTLYPDLQASLAAAQADPDVEEIVWAINSPGGMCDGLFDLLDDIAAVRAANGKPMRVQAREAQSAAYGIAAAAGPITAEGRMSAIGSVGVATAAFVLGDMIGKVVHLTNTDAPEKRPALGTPEGDQVVVRYLDQIGAEFMGAIARGRGIPLEDVAAKYGRGSSMLAPAAFAAGMIDRIATRQPLDSAAGRRYAAHDMAEPVNAVAPATEPAPVVALTPDADDLLAAAALTAAERAELIELRAERQQRQDAERRALVGELVALRAETPGTAYAEGALVPRLASEPLAAMRERVAALRAAAPREAAVSPPAIAPGVPGVALTPKQQEMAAAMSEPVRKRFLAGLASRGHKETDQ